MAKDNKSLFHYTDLNAILGMVRQNGIHFRATQFSKLNDSHEFKWIYDDIKEELAKEAKLSLEEFTQLYEHFAYIISLSKMEDDFWMWALYGKQGYGIMLELDFSVLQEEADKDNHRGYWVNDNSPDGFDILLEEKYAEEKDKRQALDSVVCDMIKALGKDFDGEESWLKKIYASAFVKRQVWSKEGEVRYVRFRTKDCYVQYAGKNACDFKTAEDVHEVSYRARGTDVIPFLEVAFTPKALRRIFIGNRLGKKVKDDIQRVLDTYGDKYKHVKIKQSKCIF